MKYSNLTYSQTHPISTSWDVFARFDSSGKERDTETGLSYFGARYYDADLLTGWLSLDPLADKYPSISPYAYCAWTRPTGGDEHRWIKYNIVNNPVKLVDPDGKDVELVVDSKAKTIMIIRKEVTNYKVCA